MFNMGLTMFDEVVTVRYIRHRARLFYHKCMLQLQRVRLCALLLLQGTLEDSGPATAMKSRLYTCYISEVEVLRLTTLAMAGRPNAVLGAGVQVHWLAPSM